MKEFIEKWEKIFKDNKYEMGSAFILYNMSCHEKYQELNEEQKEKILSFAYDLIFIFCIPSFFYYILLLLLVNITSGYSFSIDSSNFF